VPLCGEITNHFSGLRKYGKSDGSRTYVFCIFYADRVFKGLDAKQTVELGWYLPKTIVRQSIRLFTQDPSLINKQLKDLPGQYYLLKDALQNYRDIEKMEAGIQLFKNNKIVETRRYSDVILQVRKRLFITRDLKMILKKHI
jgi:hypothetical protein